MVGTKHFQNNIDFIVLNEHNEVIEQRLFQNYPVRMFYMKIRVITKSAQAVENIIRFQKEVLSNKKQNVLVDTCG